MVKEILGAAYNVTNPENLYQAVIDEVTNFYDCYNNRINQNSISEMSSYICIHLSPAASIRGIPIAKIANVWVSIMDGLQVPHRNRKDVVHYIHANLVKGIDK